MDTKQLIQCGSCDKCFTIYEALSECYCPYCGVVDTIEDDDVSTD